MYTHIHRGRLAGIAALAFAATACSGSSDPATQEPVTLTPGLYETRKTTKVKHLAAETEAGKPVCVRAGDAESFPHKLAESSALAHRGCQTVRAPRVGNTVSGEVVCGVDRKMAAGSNRFVYSGALAADRVTLEGNRVIDVELPKGAGGPGVSDAQLKQAMKRIEDVKTVIEAKRVSDC
ncbi:MAG: DUF3617 family protein [Hyphomonas sp.]